MWKNLIVYDIVPDRYIINDKGYIIDLKTKWFVKQKLLSGYYVVSLPVLPDRKYKTFRVHRLVISSFIFCTLAGNNVINHIDANKLNNNIDNLEFTTISGNTRHAIKNHCRKLVEGEVEPMYKSTSPRAGVANGNNSVFTSEQVHEICKMMEQSIPYPQILENMNLPVDKNLLDILTKIRSKKLWYGISCKYNIPNKEYRREAIHYDDEFVIKICEMLKENINISYSELAKSLNVNIDDLKDFDRFRHFVKRIKDKKTFSRISDKYF